MALLRGAALVPQRSRALGEFENAVGGGEVLVVELLARGAQALGGLVALGHEQVALAGVGDVVELAVDVERHQLVVPRLDLLQRAPQGGDLAAALAARDLVRLPQHA
ncbi:MAG: hypothetical protein IT383_18400 [Deltaproteobacteria bacterium]|nr:hypothetical protein [Deltaproteobacteria bacterium]